MTQTRTIRCDRCGNTESFDPANRMIRETGWAYIAVSLDIYDICPSCWKTIEAELKPKSDKT